ncbi:uncharacterized protein A4U43_C02F6040 [Asparagus officinalis]|uniref:Uncharacterized protein n=1 Tax=Asparagus officinalis TaxID=4686 RepID=A0A5P1FLC4_ASPOF|nr:uncharacterized protein A4U43_C02F6040 [Asparagus officinalis]
MKELFKVIGKCCLDYTRGFSNWRRILRNLGLRFHSRIWERGMKQKRLNLWVQSLFKKMGNRNLNLKRRGRRKRELRMVLRKRSRPRKRRMVHGKLEDAVNGENSLENNSLETKSKTKKKKKKKDFSDSASESNGVSGDATVEQDVDNGDEMGSDDLVNFDENVISNLQKQFEKVAAEAGLDLSTTPVAERKKRKRAKSASKLASVNNEENEEKSVKKVRFSMKNNLVWKPQTPLPPQSLRLPPSATPRGSALKKGVLPGPIRETPPTTKRINAKGSSVKKGRKCLKGVSPSAKKILKLQNFSV